MAFDLTKLIVPVLIIGAVGFGIFWFINLGLRSNWNVIKMLKGIRR